ncbi:hypothetical protein BC567DRAFT_209641 [Phyllosticta citribraziliensis]
MAPSTPVYRDNRMFLLLDVNPPSDMVRSCVCRICGRNNGSRREFNAHMADDHDGITHYMCPGCNDMWTNHLSSLRRHYWRSCRHDHERSPQQLQRIRDEQEASRRRDRRAEREKRRLAQKTQEEFEELMAEVESLEEEMESVDDRAKALWRQKEAIKERLGGTVAEGGPATEDEYRAMVAHHDEIDRRYDDLNEELDALGDRRHAAKKELGQSSSTRPNAATFKAQPLTPSLSHNTSYPHVKLPVSSWREAEASTDLANPTCCRICGVEYFYHTKLVVHCKEEHPDTKPYRCPVCYSAMTNNFDHLKRHMKGPCSRPNAAQEIAQLKLAAESNNNPSDAVTNMQSAFWRTTCRMCGYLAAHEKDLGYHFFDQHRPELWLFKCGGCGHGRSTVKKFLEHVQYNCGGDNTQSQEDGGLEDGRTGDGEAAHTEQVGSASTTQNQAGPRSLTPLAQPTNVRALPSQPPLSPTPPPSEELQREFLLTDLMLQEVKQQLVHSLKEDLGGVVESAIEKAFSPQQHEAQPTAAMKSTAHEVATAEQGGISGGGRKQALEAEARQLRIQLHEQATRLVEIEEQLQGGVEEDQEMEEDQDMLEQYGGEYQEDDSDGDGE